MKRDLQDELPAYLENQMPRLTHLKLIKIENREIHCFASSHLGAYKKIRDKELRVASIGRTFLDMLRNAELCGGMQHVLDTFQSHSELYLQLIVDEIDRHGAPIDKVRAGYILEEKMKLSHAQFDAWAKQAQRGGTRKLDPQGEYVPIWSNKWCLSLNV